MKLEKNYEFRQRMDQVHRPGMRDPQAVVCEDEFAIDDTYAISYAADAPQIVVDTAKDLQDYFRVSMDISMKIVIGSQTGIILSLDKTLAGEGAYCIDAHPGTIAISGFDGKGIRFAGVHLEDMLNLREAPFLKCGKEMRGLLITPRIVHSGWGIDQFPDSHFNAMLHAGFDAITIFVRGLDTTETGYRDLNDIISRAKKYGIDTYFYSYLPAYKHPDDPDAPEFFANVYTKLLNYHTGVRGVMLVGESAQFPSTDPAVSSDLDKNGNIAVKEGVRDTRPRPGYWPTEDYPRWLQRVSDAVHAANPEARIIFNTYNWGWTPVEVRRKFLASIPKDIIIQVTFDIFAEKTIGGLPHRVMDYSCSVSKPSYYFDTECHAAAEFGIPLLSTANTSGLCWDFGDIPYIPVPQQWIRRYKELDRFRRECGLTRFYDNHHYGWWPSVMTELGKWYFQSPQCDIDEMLKKLANWMAGAAAAPMLLEAWNYWSEAIQRVPATNEDQYGPLRVGASYPFIFHPNITREMTNKEIKFPTAPHAHFGYKIIKTMYQPFENINQLPGSIRYPAELNSLNEALELWNAGLECYGKALAAAPGRKKAAMEYELNLGKFIMHSITTCRNMKQWYMLNQKLMAASTAEIGLELLDQIEELAKAEVENAKATIPLVEMDSRLGWEPSQEYVCDKWHLEWKLRQMDSVINGEIANYRTILKLALNK